ncbi:MAG: hypothetical protein J6R77_03565 [Clostridia bacterium]|nr:hypothetical protein [Clostridia bacterium]
MQRFYMALMRFMAGRYGVDALSRAFPWLYLALFIVNFFLRSWIVMLLELAVLAVWLFRMLSRNTVARVRENEWYLSKTARLRAWMRLQQNRWRYRHTHVFRTCSHCKALVRLPKTKRGRHTCNCPRCGREFSVKI